jgi:uncharacterized DUF497 family protein
MRLLFEWDPEKARGNARKHRVTFDEAASVFEDPLSATIFDPVHSDDEDRYVIVGISNKRRIIVVCFTDRDEKIRIISARKATKREQAEYEEGS